MIHRLYLPKDDMKLADYKSFYVDYMGFNLDYYLGETEIGCVMSGEIYHCFNGFLKLSVL